MRPKSICLGGNTLISSQLNIFSLRKKSGFCPDGAFTYLWSRPIFNWALRGALMTPIYLWSRPFLWPSVFSMRRKRKASALAEQHCTLWWPHMDRTPNALMTGPTGRWLLWPVSLYDTLLLLLLFVCWNFFINPALYDDPTWTRRSMFWRLDQQVSDCGCETMTIMILGLVSRSKRKWSMMTPH